MTTADSIRFLEAFRRGAEKQSPNLGRIIARMKAIEARQQVPRPADQPQRKKGNHQKTTLVE
jgi:hypothetical protein